MTVIEWKIKDWKREVIDLVIDFQFHPESGDIEKLKWLLLEAEKIAENRERLANGL